MSQPSFDFGDEPLDDPVNPTYTVGELAEAINGTLRAAFDQGVWVRGEIHGWSNRGPHSYFSLVEHTDDGRAVLNVQLFAPMKRNLTPVLRRHRLELRDGMKVRIHGHLDFWAQGGRLGLKMAGIDPRFTLGELSVRRDEVMRRLVAAGLVDTNRRRRLARSPHRVGVVASLDSAAWHDFRHEIVASGFGFALTVVDVRVQGDLAPTMVSGGIRALAARDDLDVIVVIRGGGARNELATFDDESIAVAIATAPVPVFTGLGHETDRSVADEVAHTAWKTPTAVAAGLIGAVRDEADRGERAWAAISRLAEARLASDHGRVIDRAHRIRRCTTSSVDRAGAHLAARVERLRRAPTRALADADARLAVAADRVARRPVERLEYAELRLDTVAARLAAVDPAVQLARGWSITRTADGDLVRDVDGLAPGTELRTQLASGEITSTVTAATPVPATSTGRDDPRHDHRTHPPTGEAT